MRNLWLQRPALGRFFSSRLRSLLILPALAVVLSAVDLRPAQAAPPVRVGTTNSSSDAPFFIADKKGYFKQEGLEVVFTPFDSAAKMIAPLGTGQLDVGAGAPSAGLYNATARNINIKIVADKGSMPPGYGYLSMLVRKDLIDSGRFKGYRDLKGLKVALPAPGTSTDSTLEEALKKGGLKIGDVELVHMGFPQHVPALQNRAVDVSITTEPSVTRAVQSKAAVRFAGGDEIYPHQQLAVVLYSGEFIKSQPEAAQRFMRAYIKAVRDYNDALNDGKLAGPGADEIIAILTQATSIKDAEVHRTITPNGCNPDGKVNIASLKKDLDSFQARGLLQGKIALDQVVDPTFVEAVVKELGPYKSRSK